nr:probable disease resistance protein RF9 [Malus domestica]
MVEKRLHRVFQYVYLLIELALVLPVATASVERAFYAMNIIKSPLCNIMRDQWLNDSLVVYIEKDVFSCIDNETIMTRFQNSEIDAKKEELGKKMPQHCADSKIDPEKEKLGKEMLKHCAGLPLAITVLAGLLARKVTVEEWKKVHENVDVYIRRGTNLDQEYKGDQEYAGHFPEDYEIPVKRLRQLWIAEGFISSASQGHGSAEVLEDVAYTCLSELVQRCMVQVGTLGSTKKIKTCHLHDLMRDLCLVKAEEEDFLHVVNFTSTITKAATIPKVRRLGVYVEEKCVESFAPTRNDHLRSLLFFVDPEYGFSNWKKKFLRGKLKLATLGNLQSLVNVAGADCDLNHLAELTNLRKLFIITGGVKNMEEMLKSTGITFNHIRSLSLSVGDEVMPMNMVLSCPHIYNLELAGRMRDKSLEGLQYYQNLTKMSLWDTNLPLESLKILEKIPNLRMLWLHCLLGIEGSS